MIRRACVAGSFYPDNAAALKEEISSCVTSEGEKVEALGVMSPHAGYFYSGRIAGAVYSRVVLPGTFIILCPNHTGLGHPLSLMREGEWETPLGKVPVDTGLALDLSRSFELLKDDPSAHLQEHSLEVQLPFIQYLKGSESFTFVPLCLSERRLEILEEE